MHRCKNCPTSSRWHLSTHDGISIFKVFLASLSAALVASFLLNFEILQATLLAGINEYLSTSNLTPFIPFLTTVITTFLFALKRLAEDSTKKKT